MLRRRRCKTKKPRGGGHSIEIASGTSDSESGSVAHEAEDDPEGEKPAAGSSSGDESVNGEAINEPVEDINSSTQGADEHGGTDALSAPEVSDALDDTDASADDSAELLYVDWAAVAAAVNSGELAGEGFKPAGSGAKEDPYAIKTPEAFAWWAISHAENEGSYARLDADIDLTARTLGGSGDDADHPLPWPGDAVLAGELDGQGHAVVLRTSGAGLFGEVAVTGAVRWLTVGESQDAAAARVEAGKPAAGVYAESTRAGSIAGINKGTVEGVVNLAPVSAGDPAANADPAAPALAGGIVGENDGRIADCANLGDVSNASALAGSAAAGIAGAGVGTMASSYNASSVRAASNGAYLTTTLTADEEYANLVDAASCYLVPGEGATYEGIALERDGALSAADLRDAAERLNAGRDAASSPWSAAAGGATRGFPAPAKPNPEAAEPAPGDPDGEEGAEGAEDAASDPADDPEESSTAPELAANALSLLTDADLGAVAATASLPDAAVTSNAISSRVAVPDSCFAFKRDSTGENLVIKGFASSYTAMSDIVIPSTVFFDGRYRKVVEIDREAFLGDANVRRVVIPDTVTLINEGAFNECPNLTYLEIGEGAVDIPDTAFMQIGEATIEELYVRSSSIASNFGTWSQFSNVRKLTVDAETIGEGAFAGMPNLVSLTLTDRVKAIGNYGFMLEQQLETLVIPSSVETIGEAAFYECTALKSVEIGAGVTHLGKDAFGACQAIETVRWEPASSTIDGTASVFSDSTNIKEISIASSTVVPNMFRGNQSPFSVTFEDTVNVIQEDAFAGCSNMVSAHIPESVTSIGRNAFFNCSNDDLTVELLIVPSMDVMGGSDPFDGCSANAWFVINDPSHVISSHLQSYGHDNIVNIGEYASSKFNYEGLRYEVREFYNSNTSTGRMAALVLGLADDVTATPAHITIPSTIPVPWDTTVSAGVPVYSVSETAFAGLRELTSIELPDTLEVIETLAFASSGLQSIAIPDSCVSIGGEAFYDCKDLTSIDTGTIPLTDAFIESTAFKAGSIETSVTIGCEEVTGSDVERVFGDRIIVSATFDGTNQTIGDRAFANKTDLVSVRFTGTNQSLGLRAFASTGITEVEIPASVTEVAGIPFEYCSSLVSATIGSSAPMTYGYGYFPACPSLQDVTITAETLDGRVITDDVGNQKVNVTFTGDVSKVGKDAITVAHLGKVTFEPAATVTFEAGALTPTAIDVMVFGKDSHEYSGGIDGRNSGVVFKSGSFSVAPRAVIAYGSPPHLDNIDNNDGNVVGFLAGSNKATLAVMDARYFDAWNNGSWYNIGFATPGEKIETEEFDYVVMPGDLTTCKVVAYHPQSGFSPDATLTVPEVIPCNHLNSSWFTVDGIDYTPTLTVESIGTTSDQTFFGNPDDAALITSVELPASIETIEDGVFEYMNNLSNIVVDEKNEHLASIDMDSETGAETLVSKDGTSIVASPGLAGSVVVPDTVKTIERSAFANQVRYARITAIDLPSSLESVSEEAFRCYVSGIVDLGDGSGTVADESVWGGATVFCSASATGKWADSGATVMPFSAAITDSATDLVVIRDATGTMTASSDTTLFTGAKGKATLEWTSSDESVATVSASADTATATVTGKKMGTATITAKLKYDGKDLADAGSPIVATRQVSVSYGSWEEVGAAVDAGTLKDDAGAAVVKPGQDAGGTYLLKTPEDLGWFAYKVNRDNASFGSANAKIVLPEGQTGLDMTGATYGGTTSEPIPWSPIGNSFVDNSSGNYDEDYGWWDAYVAKPFTGSFDGAGCTFSHLSVRGASNLAEALTKGGAAGFFGAVDGTGNKIGGINLDATCSVAACVNYLDAVYSDSYTTKAVFGLGSIVGAIGGTTTVSDCSNAAKVTMLHPGNEDGTTPPNVGGIVGAASDASIIERCSNAGDIVVSWERASAIVNAAGIVGLCNRNAAATIIRDCYNTGSVTASGESARFAAGIAVCYLADGAIIENCYSTGTVGMGAVSGWEYYAGGIALNGKVTNSYYLDTSVSNVHADATGTSKTMTEMKDAAFADTLNAGRLGVSAAWAADSASSPANSGYPVLQKGSAPAGWAEVGKAVYDSKLTGTGFLPTGAGTEANPYTIASPEGLAAFAYAVNNKLKIGTESTAVSAQDSHAKIELPAGQTELDLSGAAYTGVAEADIAADFSNCLQWEPIGNHAENTRFSGTFDGNGFGVSNMKVSGKEDIGLFGTIAGATVKNVGVNSGHVTGTVSHIGGTIGYVYSKASTVSGCWNNATVNANSYNAGGVVGCTNKASGTVIEKCWNTGAVTQTGGDSVGGIVGKPHSGNQTIRDCYNAGTITGVKFAGGIVGNFADSGYKVENCYNVGTVALTPATNAGGSLSGSTGGATFSNCYYLENTCNSTSPVAAGASRTADQLKSWGAAWALNSGKLDGAWTLDDTSAPTNGGYPVFGSALRAANDWPEVAIGVENGFVGSKPSGDGSTTNPFQIGAPEQLAWFAYALNAGTLAAANQNATLTADLDLAGAVYTGAADAGVDFANSLAWQPIAVKSSGGTIFAGTFDGARHHVENLRAQNGMFGIVSGTVKDFGVESGRIEGHLSYTGDAYVGAIVTDMNNGSVVERCYSKADVTCAASSKWVYVGGLVGEVRSGAIVRDCYATGDVTVTKGTDYPFAGGLAGDVNGTMSGNRPQVLNSYTTGSVSITDSTGGIAGRLATVRNGGSVTNCYYNSEATTTAPTIAEQGTALEVEVLKTSAFANKLNATDASANGRYGDAAVWYVDDDTPTNGGYATLERNVSDWNAVAATVEPMSISTDNVVDTTGNGAADSQAYEIDTAEQLAWYASQINMLAMDYGMSSGVGMIAPNYEHAILTADIDLFGTDYLPAGTDASNIDNALEWTPIGGFGGIPAITFDGQSHTVKHLHNSKPSENYTEIGLFGYVRSCTISNLTVTDGLIKRAAGELAGTQESFGGVVGYIEATTVVSNCSNEGVEVSVAGGGEYNVGGIIGTMDDGELVRCRNTAKVSSGAVADECGIGGVAGFAGGATIADCYNRGAVEGADKAGGIVGVGMNGYKLSNSYSTGTVTGPSGGAQGALVGTDDSSADVANCYYDSDISGATQGIAGVADAAGVAEGLPTADMKAAAPKLNADRHGPARVWTASSGDSVNGGYPVFDLSQPKEDQAAVTVTLNPASPVKHGTAVTATGQGGSGSGAWSYESSNTAVATVDAKTGKITTVGVGIATITATRAEDDAYLAASGTADLTVTKGDQAAPPGITGVPANAGASAYLNGTTADMEYATSATAAAWTTCTASRTNVPAAGTYYVRFKATANYNAGAAASVVVGLGTQAALSLGFNSDGSGTSSTVKFGGTAQLYVAGGSGAGKVTYTSSNTAIAIVDDSGKITANGTAVGNVTITAAKAGDDAYNQVTSNQVTLTVQLGDASAPSGLTATAASGSVKGLFSGTSPLMEYVGPSATEPSSSASATPCLSTFVQVDKAGTYWVRYAATATTSASDWARVDVPLGTQTLTTSLDSTNIGLSGTARATATSNAGSAATGSITYHSSDESVATVDAATGVVTPHKAGTADIYAKIEADETYNAVESAKVTLTVAASGWADVGKAVYDGTLKGTDFTPAGTGAAGDPYVVSTPEALAAFAYAVNNDKAFNSGTNARSSHVQLANNIDLMGAAHGNTTAVPLQWEPMGTGDATQFKGVIDGDYHEIDHLYIKNSSRIGVGLVGWARNVTIKNLGIGENSSITGSKDVSAFVGACNVVKDSLIIENCYNLAAVSGSTYAGAFLGDDSGAYSGNDVGSITNCYNAGNASFGAMSSGTVDNCFADTEQYANAALHEKKQGSGVKALTTAQMQSWAAAWALNGDKLSGAWATDDASTNGGYPVFGSGLRAAVDWAEVGAGVDAGLVDGAPSGTGVEADPYLVGTPTALAAYAYAANNDKSFNSGENARTAHVKLTDDIDLSGTDYTGASGVESDITKSLPWSPIGTANTAAAAYNGSVDGDGYEIDFLYFSDTGRSGVGLIGWGDTLSIKNLGIGEHSSITGNSDVAAFVGGHRGTTSGSLAIDRCYNRAAVTGATTWIGAFLGDDVGATSVRDVGSITNSYNAGKAKFGNLSSGRVDNCYADIDQFADAGEFQQANVSGAGSGVGKLTTSRMQSWAAAWALNGDALAGAWNTDASDAAAQTNDGYPVFGSALRAAADWGEVGLGVDAGLVEGAAAGGDGSVSSPFQLGTPQALAWFAFKVNQGTADGLAADHQNAKLTASIDLAGEVYGGNAGAADYADCLKWEPVGTTKDTAFAGTFDGAGFALDNLRVSETDASASAGLFGCASDATIKNVHLASGAVSGTSATGSMLGSVCAGQVVIEDCVNDASVSGISVGGLVGVTVAGNPGANLSLTRCGNRGSLTGSERAGGLLALNMANEWGDVSDGGIVTVESCFSTGSVSSGKFAGGFLGRNHNAHFTARNSYFAALMTRGGNDENNVFASNGKADSLNLVNCYFDTTILGESTTGTPLTTAQMKSWSAAYKLNENTYVGSTDGTQPTSTVWTTDAATASAQVNGGYPVFGDLSLVKRSVVLDPAATVASGGITSGAITTPLGVESPLSGQVTLLAAPNSSGMTGATLEDAATVDAGFSTWGTTSANATVALVAGSTSLKTDTAANAILSMDGLSSLTLHAAAAYTHGSDRTTSFAVMDALTGYEITATIKAVTSKTLDVTLPVETGTSFALEPDGSLHAGDSAARSAAASTVTSNNSVPVAGEVKKVEPLAKGVTLGSSSKKVNAVLTPAAPDAALAANANPITDASQVKLYAAVPGSDASLTPLAAARYFDPTKGTVPLFFAMPGNEKVAWKWGLDYSGTYFGEEGVFGYAASYAFGLPVDDVDAAQLSGTAIGYTAL